jgi:hypothetical protein
MAYEVRRIDYFYTTIEVESGAAGAVLSRLEELGVNLVAFAALPLGPTRTQLTLFPDDDASMEHVASDAGMTLDGPHPAILVQGDDELGALGAVHAKLAAANVNVYASTGVADGQGHYGYVIYVRPEEIDRAMSSLA